MSVRYFVNRLLQALLTIFVLLAFIFAAARATGDPTVSLLPLTASTEERASFRQALHLDEPIVVQFTAYLWDLARGDLGNSYYWDRPVSELIWDRLPVTVTLALLAGTITLGIGLPLGIIAAQHRGRPTDHVVLMIALLGQSVPIFVIGLLGILFFSVKLRWLPVAGVENAAGYVLPVIALGWFGIASMIRVTRVSMLNALSAEYILTAKAKGLRSRAIIYGHALRNALIPVITIFSLILATLLTGTVVTETMFALPGLGRLAVEAIIRRDFPVVQAVILVTTLVFILVNFCVDILYGVIDPRTRRGNQ